MVTVKLDSELILSIAITCTYCSTLGVTDGTSEPLPLLSQ